MESSLNSVVAAAAGGHKQPLFFLSGPYRQGIARGRVFAIKEPFFQTTLVYFMKEIFKQLREKQEDYPQTFTGAIFPYSPYWLQPIPEGESIEAGPLLEVTTTDEKKEALKSLENFAQTKLAKEEKISFSGGELRHKSQEHCVQINSNLISLQEYLNKFTQPLFENLTELEQRADILFLGESESGREMVSKMISAMKLDESRIGRLPLEFEDAFMDGDLQLERIYQEIFICSPKVVVTFGAKVTNMLLNKKERLSQVHGSFFTRTLAFKNDVNLSFELVPVFHPDFLSINPKMKRTAWADLQKVMSFLKNGIQND